MEKDDEVKGSGNSYTTEFRFVDTRIGRWLSLDPLMNMFPESSPYEAFANNPIFFIDPYGLSPSTIGTEGEPDPINLSNQDYHNDESNILPNNPQDGQIVNVSYNNYSTIRQYTYKANLDLWETKESYNNGQSWIEYEQFSWPSGTCTENEQLAQIAPSGQQLAQQSSRNSNNSNGSNLKSGIEETVKNVSKAVKVIHKKLKTISGSSGYINASIGLTALSMKADLSSKSLTKMIKAKQIELKIARNTPRAPIRNEIKSLKIQRAGTKALSKVFNFAGKALGVMGAAVSIADAYENPTAKNITKAVIDTGIIFVTRAFPITAAVYGIASGIGSLLGAW